MLKGLTLTELAKRIEELSTQKQDFIADTGSQVAMSVVNNKPELVVAEQGSYPILSAAHSQIGSRLNIPAVYYNRMLSEQPDLLANNVNHWFKANPEKRMVRTLKGNNRAFLSNKYQRVENEEIAQVALPLLLASGMQIVSCEVTERRMYIQAISKNLEAKVEGSRRVGDIVHGGVVISNSEIGQGAVSVSDFDYYLACLNGLISGRLMNASHVGRKIEDNADLWADDTREADDKAMILKVRDMVTAALDKARFTARVERMSNLTQIKMGGNVQAAVEVLGTKIGATVEETGGILKALIEGGDLSAWGVVNAVTAQAHTASDYDRAVDFEMAGGQLLELKPNEWAEVLGAEKVPVRRVRKQKLLAVAA
jgi:hypothetical protein